MANLPYQQSVVINVAFILSGGEIFGNNTANLTLTVSGSQAMMTNVFLQEEWDKKSEK